MLECGVKLSDIYEKMPDLEILISISRELTFNEFEIVAFYMFLKKIGWSSRQKLRPFSEYFRDGFVEMKA